MIDPVAALDAQSFVRAAGAPFLAAPPGRPPVPLRLVDVSELDVPGTEQFSLVFAGPAEPALGQGICQVDHGQLGRFGLFLVPVGRDQGTAMYQAVFNRLTQR